MSFATSISTWPVANQSDRGAEAASLFPGYGEGVARLVAGAAGSSAYLSDIFHKEADWFKSAVNRPAEQVFDEILTQMGEGDDLAKSLRIAKRRAALWIALADLGGVWSLDQVTDALSRLADGAISTALSQLIRAEFERGKLPMCGPDDLLTDCGMSVIGMGKLGAKELNYSSDIDLIVLFDETRFAPDDYAQARKTFVRVTQNLVKILSEMTGDGYVFRTDLRLRPDPSVTPVCIAMEAAENYYESLGRTWERAAMIKARPVAGDINAGQGFLDRLKPFVWRRHLDFTAIEGAQDMLLKIRAHKKLQGALEFAGHDMKLGLGGIREIEFFAQTHQLIFGGREVGLRSPRTQDALRALAASQRIPAETAEVLCANYAAHRDVEHRIQMLDDAQTHLIPKNPEKLLQLANLSGFKDAKSLEEVIAPRLLEVHAHTEIEPATRSGGTPAPVAVEIEELFEAREQNWFTLAALRNGRAREIYQRLKPSLMHRFSTVSYPDVALLRFEQFLSGLPSGVQVFSLFEGTPMLLDLVIDICAISPALAEYIGRNKAVLDAVLDRDFFEAFPEQSVLQAYVDDMLAGAGDYEQVLDALRRWQKEAHFRNGVHLLRGISTPREAGLVYSLIADVSVAALLPHVEAHLAHRFGPAPGRGAAILAMGKLGSREMTASSDLDLIVIYDGAGATETAGPKAISVGAYFARFTKALIGALTVPTAEGSLYEVDMRLRPSGRNGPVAISLPAFAEYQANEAWTWEHLALTRARIIGGATDLAQDVMAAVASALAMPRDRQKTLSDVREMRGKLAEAHRDTVLDVWELKRGPGHLLDIELYVQCATILAGVSGVQAPQDMILALTKDGHLTEENGEVLRSTYRLLGSLQQIGRLVGEGFNPDVEGERTKDIICRIADVEQIGEVSQQLTRLTQSAKTLIDQMVSNDRTA